MTTKEGTIIRVRRNNATLFVTLPRDRGWQEGDLAQWEGDRLLRVRVVPRKGIG